MKWMGRRKILEAEKMKEQLIKWATAGDGDCMYKLAKIYRNEGNIPAADK